MLLILIVVDVSVLFFVNLWEYNIIFCGHIMWVVHKWKPSILLRLSVLCVQIGINRERLGTKRTTNARWQCTYAVRLRYVALGLLYFAVWSPVSEWNMHESLLLPCVNPRLHTSCHTHPDSSICTLHLIMRVAIWTKIWSVEFWNVASYFIWWLEQANLYVSSDHDFSLP